MTLQLCWGVPLLLAESPAPKANILDKDWLFRAVSTLASAFSVSCTFSQGNNGGAAEGLVVTVAAAALNEATALVACAYAADATIEMAKPREKYPFMVTADSLREKENHGPAANAKFWASSGYFSAISIPRLAVD